jgi:hypothetical protein
MTKLKITNGANQMSLRPIRCLQRSNRYPTVGVANQMQALVQPNASLLRPRPETSTAQKQKCKSAQESRTLLDYWGKITERKREKVCVISSVRLIGGITNETVDRLGR